MTSFWFGVHGDKATVHGDEHGDSDVLGEAGNMADWVIFAKGEELGIGISNREALRRLPASILSFSKISDSLKLICTNSKGRGRNEMSSL